MLKQLLYCLSCVLLGAMVQGAEPERSVVQIITFSQQPRWDMPWRFDTVRRSSGSGFVIEGQRIMSNAHVVSWARQILLRRYQDPRLYLAQVRFVGHDCDLALLEVEDKSFFEGLEPLEFGKLPEVRSTVVTYGYPAGGEELSYTRGVVSRIELQKYVHIGNRSFLAVQTDAAINPGNSGGPVIQDDRVVGVAFQNIPGLENSGFFIPPPIVEHFLEDVEDGRYDGFPMAGLRMVDLQNPAYRLFLKMPDNGQGARVDSVLPIDSTREVLEPDDVILQVADYPVGSDGSILFEDNRVFGSVAFQTVQSGESIPLKILRDGRTQNLSLPMHSYDGDRLLGNQYEQPPRYYIYAGLVFTPLSLDYLKTMGRNWRDLANTELVYELMYRRFEDPEEARPEPVVLCFTLASPANANIRISRGVLVDRINDRRIERLEDVIEAFETATNSHHVMEFLPNQAIETLDRARAEAEKGAILETYGVQRDRRL